MDPGAVEHRGQRFVCAKRTMVPCNPKVESSGHSAVNLCRTSMMTPIQKINLSFMAACSIYSVFLSFILSLLGSVHPDDAVRRTLVWPVAGNY